MAQKTAVEYLIDELIEMDELTPLGLKVLEKAKQMEKDQIVNTYLNACKALTPYGYYKNSAEQYYNETYGK